MRATQYFLLRLNLRRKLIGIFSIKSLSTKRKGIKIMMNLQRARFAINHTHIIFLCQHTDAIPVKFSMALVEWLFQHVHQTWFMYPLAYLEEVSFFLLLYLKETIVQTIRSLKSKIMLSFTPAMLFYAAIQNRKLFALIYNYDLLHFI